MLASNELEKKVHPVDFRSHLHVTSGESALHRSADLVTVFNGIDRVISREGMVATASLHVGMEVLTRRGFRRLTAIELVEADNAPVYIPAIYSSSRTAYWGDRRRVLFLSGKSLLRATGFSRALLLASDISAWVSEIPGESSYFAGRILKFEEPEIVVTDLGPFASTAVGSGFHILTKDQAERAFEALLQDSPGRI